MTGEGNTHDRGHSPFGFSRLRDKMGNNVATLLRNSRMAYETGDDALIEQSEDAVRALVVSPLVKDVQRAYETGDEALIEQAEELLRSVLPIQREPGTS